MTKRVLHLRITPRTGGHDELGAFLREAIPYYQKLPGVRIRLLRSTDDPTRYIEVVEYETAGALEADETRMATDPHMQDLLQAWRATLAGEVVVESYEDVTEAI